MTSLSYPKHFADIVAGWSDARLRRAVHCWRTPRALWCACRDERQRRADGREEAAEGIAAILAYQEATE